jgi:Ca2+-binding EF-hand superfamily protein
MIKNLLASATLLIALLAPASAQQTEEGTAMTPAECRSLFMEVDTNGDGILSQQEIAAADLGDVQAGTSLSQFMAECLG